MAALAAEAAERGLVPYGATFRSLTSTELDDVRTRSELVEMAQLLAERSFTLYEDGNIVILIADVATGSVRPFPRLNGSTPHGLESTDPQRWGGFRRIGIAGSTIVLPSEGELMFRIAESKRYYPYELCCSSNDYHLLRRLFKQVRDAGVRGSPARQEAHTRVTEQYPKWAAAVRSLVGASDSSPHSTNKPCSIERNT